MRNGFSAASWWFACGLMGNLLLIPGYGTARELWPNNYLHFFSKDMRPVQVLLLRDEWNKSRGGINLSVPRAWITFTSRHNPMKLDQLPDQVEAATIKISLSDPDGKPLSVRVDEVARAEKIDRNTAIDRVRSDMYWANLGAITVALSKKDWDQRSLTRATQQKEGLPYDPNRGQYMIRSDDGLLLEASCPPDPNPRKLCTYGIRLSPDVWASLAFLDFRMHGGSAYALSRTRNALRAICGLKGLTCSDVPDNAR